MWPLLCELPLLFACFICKVRRRTYCRRNSFAKCNGTSLDGSQFPSTVQVTLVFSEPVFNFTIEDINVVGSGITKTALIEEYDPVEEYTLFLAVTGTLPSTIALLHKSTCIYCALLSIYF